MIEETEPMSLFRFRTRGVESDRRTDEDRLRRLLDGIATIRAEVLLERNGLRARYERAAADAAFAQEEYEEDHGDRGMASKVDELTEVIIRYSERMAALDRQAAFLAGLEQELDRFAPDVTAARNRGRLRAI